MQLPCEIDDIELSEAQRKVLRSIFSKLVIEAEHELKVAYNLSIKVFRKLYEQNDKSWKAKRVVELSDASCKIIGTKFWRNEVQAQVESKV
ncbi:MAG: hypothetical protein ACTSYJ_07275 [Candidatus Thorarchaeota archaeon]